MSSVNCFDKVLVLTKTGVHNDLLEGTSISDGLAKYDELLQAASDRPGLLNYGFNIQIEDTDVPAQSRGTESKGRDEVLMCHLRNQAERHSRWYQATGVDDIEQRTPSLHC